MIFATENFMIIFVLMTFPCQPANQPTNDRCVSNHTFIAVICSMYSNRIAFHCLVHFGKIEIAFLFYKSERAYCGALCVWLYKRFVVFSTEINYDLFQALEKQSIMIL